MKNLQNYFIVFLIFAMPFISELIIYIWYCREALVVASWSIPVDLTTAQVAESSLVFIVLCTFFICSNYKKTIIIIWELLIYIPAILNIVSVKVTGYSIKSDFIITILDVDLEELIYCIHHYFLFILGSVVLLLILLRIKIKSFKVPFKYRISALILFVCSIANANFISVCKICEGALRYRSYSEALDKFQKTYSKSFSKSFSNIKSNFSAPRQNYVLVIGESVDRNHMQIYGYERPTTPCFENLKNELFVFKNVRTAHVFTSEAVKSMFELVDRRGNEELLINFFREAGFKTFWFSNNCDVNLFDSYVSRLGKTCDQYVLINSSFETLCYEKLLDEELLKYLKQALKDPADKKFIVLHLIGSHFPLNVRYPARFEKFRLPKNYCDKEKAQAVCLYDNSILYTDSVINEAINILKKDDGVSCLLYLSDHGQDIYDDESCQLRSRKTIHAYEIPFILWLSEKYKLYNSRFIQTWNTSAPFVTNKIAYSLIDLARLQHESIDLSESIFRK